VRYRKRKPRVRFVTGRHPDAPPRDGLSSRASGPRSSEYDRAVNSEHEREAAKARAKRDHAVKQPSIKAAGGRRLKGVKKLGKEARRAGRAQKLQEMRVVCVADLLGCSIEAAASMEHHLAEWESGRDGISMIELRRVQNRVIGQMIVEYFPIPKRPKWAARRGTPHGRKAIEEVRRELAMELGCALENLQDAKMRYCIKQQTLKRLGEVVLAGERGQLDSHWRRLLLDELSSLRGPSDPPEHARK
jgi:hypothetical protein